MRVWGSPQRGLPLASAIPSNTPLLALDIKDCFFSIPLHPNDCQRFAFSIPKLNNSGPANRYEWCVLPQGMANSPTICQEAVSAALAPFLEKGLHIYHYMDDLLVWKSQNTSLPILRDQIVSTLEAKGFKIAPDKIQTIPPITFLGTDISLTTVRPHKPTLTLPQPLTLNSLQSFLGNLNWLRPWLPISTSQLKPLFELLKGSKDPSSRRKLTTAAKETLNIINAHLQSVSLARYDPQSPVQFLLFNSSPTVVGAIFQPQGVIEWLHTPVGGAPRVLTEIDALASMIRQGRDRTLQILGKEPDILVTPFSLTDIQWLMRNHSSFAFSLLNFSGQIDNHYPKDKWISAIPLLPWLPPRLFYRAPIPGAPTAFTDGGCKGAAAIIVQPGDKLPITYFQALPDRSPQFKELFAVYLVLKNENGPLNLYSDSVYTVNLLPWLSRSLIKLDGNPLSPLFIKISNLLQARKAPLFVQHIRSHTDLPGPLTQGNTLADHLASTGALPVEVSPTILSDAQLLHQNIHVNLKGLHAKFPNVPLAHLRRIIRTCSSCASLITTPAIQHMGTNPRGLKANALWQIDVTHIPQFGRQKYVFVTIDTFSHFIWASAQTHENSKKLINHMLSSFAIMGIPQQLKTDNGPAFTSSAFKNFCNTWKIRHHTGIPYNPRGQGIIERAHQTLKNQLQKQSQPNYPPSIQLVLALTTLNVFNIYKSSQAPPIVLHWSRPPAIPPILVKWKDPLDETWKGPDPLLTTGRGFACVFPQDQPRPIWIPAKNVRHLPADQKDGPPVPGGNNTSKTEETTPS